MPSALFTDLYAELGIESNASFDEVRRAYHKRALETHPDKQDPSTTEKEKQEAERQFHRVHDAFEVLGDPTKRKAYDSRMRARTDPSRISAEALRRIQERKEWAQRQREESQKHSAAFYAQIEREKREKQEALERMAKEAAMIADMVKEMHELNPGFPERRKAALQRKAERERERERAARVPKPGPSGRPIHSS